MLSNTYPPAPMNQADQGAIIPNEEWELSDLIHLVTEEIEQVQDTLLLKSHNRRLMMMVNELHLDLQVDVRRDPKGKLLFRTVTPGQTGMSSLKLDFGHLLDTQIQEIHKSSDFKAEKLYGLDTLPNIDSLEIQTLKGLSIDSIAALELATQTPAMLTELSQKTGIDEARIRSWRQLPYISAVQPEQGPPGSVVVITGDKFGKGQVQVFFQDRLLPIDESQSTETRLIVEIPQDLVGSGALVVQVNEQQTNAKTWRVELSDIAVQDISLKPSPKPGIILFQAILANLGEADAEPCQVQWELIEPRGTRLGLPISIVCPPLRAGETIFTEPVPFECRRPGQYRIICTADPAGKLTDRLRTNQSFTKTFMVPSHGGNIFPNFH
ncbi:MAG: hypothetical protein Kow00121_32640 [Elainellaceae cyanobacterium]